MLEYLRQMLSAALEERTANKAKMDQSIAQARSDKRELTDEERAAFDAARAAVVADDAKIEDLRSRIKDAEEDERREASLHQVRSELGITEKRTETTNGSPAVITKEERTYRAYKDHRGQLFLDPNGPSFFRDLVKASLNLPGDREARERLERSRKEDLVEMNAENRALTTTDGAGGDFVPPVWLVDQYIGLARAARPLADRVRNLPLPAGTDSINIPRLATGTAVAEQATQNTAVQNTDATTNAVNAAVTTIAGAQTLAVQLIEQSPVNLDDILLQDLALDYAAKVDVFVISNNVAGKRGLLNVTGTNAITAGTATVAGLYPKFADAVQQIYTGRYLPPDTIAMHPRRWAFFLAALDTQNRPLIVPGSGAALNQVGTNSPTQAPQGLTGELMGIQVVVDPNIPTNLGAGTNQDPVFVMRAQDSILWEGAAHMEAFRETKADTLSVYLRFYRYVAFTAERYPKSVSVINGAGLVTPTF